MRTIRSFLFASTVLITSGASAQTAPSDSLFNVDQVVTVNLTFADPDFWNTLTTHYTNDVGETLTADVTVTDLTGSHTYSSVEVDLKGNSTYGHPGNKKSFKIDFNDNISGQKYHGMTKAHFNNCFKDPTFMREKVFFDYAREQGVLAPRVSYANVSMNGTFWGFYVMVEPVDKNFLDRWVDDNNGNLFKAGDNFGGGPSGSGNAADMAYYGTDQNNYSAKYELKTNETENDWSDLLALLDLLNNSNAADLQSQYPQQWEWNQMLRSLALDNMFSNLDSYINSARNYYLYHDSTTFKWNWIKWDGNEAFGSYGAQGVGNLLDLAPNYVASGRPHLSKIFNNGGLYHDYEVQYCAALGNFNSSYLDPKIDVLKTLIQDHVAADPNKQYTTAQFTLNIEGNITTGGGPGGGTIFGLKSFIASRSGYLNGAIDCNTLGVDELNNDELIVYPNPTSGSVLIRSNVPLSAANIQMFDMLGRSLSFSFSANIIDISTYASGTYVARVLENGRMHQVRIMKH